MSKTQPATRNLTASVPVKLSPALVSKVAQAAEETGLKKSDVLRMSIERGVDVLLAQLNGEVQTSHPAGA